MRVAGGGLVRRWGGRAVGLAITGVGLYIVAPSILSLFGAWPRLADVNPWWFPVLVVLEACSFAGLWWLARLSLDQHTDDQVIAGWGTIATAQLAGNAASKVLPGGAATGSVLQARLLIQAGQPAAVVASALTAIGLITTGVLLLLPVLTVPAVLIGPPPARQLELGLLISLIMAVLIVGLGLAALTWPRFVVVVGRGAGHVIHLVKRSVTADSCAAQLVTQRERVAAAFEGRWWSAALAAAANRMFDYAALVAALAALDVHARPSMVLLAYVVAQALAMIPITPGGLGFVDAGLTALLVLIGISPDAALIGTLLYRLASFWLPIPVGLLAWAGWRIHLHITRPAGDG
ncbi:lysylphosphatidylglycerol synthase transmembrane domain-containing protein [Kribbella jiaozuonensis]|uniref:Flippase-like domain-containing protein n=1 Tax=Kribbella jiaozuonensis TaxID=2575441 RepID=A0A4V5UY59_9ACTN|nr:lysylphosphatidylglycerol synthase transmembrane domain-containing protein [Kribbella jiaozuonensis]TKK77503.1 flippase-like domain-containing protein [Kribbella jiaozuonensis]